MMESVYCAARTGSLYTADYVSSLKGYTWEGKRQVTECCKRGNEFLVSVKSSVFHQQLTDNQLLKTKCDSRSRFVDQNSQ